MESGSAAILWIRRWCSCDSHVVPSACVLRAPAADSGKAQALVDSGFVETHGRFSPNGEWFLYASNETGRFEVYADRFPQRGAKRRVSLNGGAWPR
jgi:hypothetical protein